MNWKNTKPVSHLNKGETFVSPSGLTWKVDEVRNMGRGKMEVLASRGMNNIRFSFRLDQEVEMA